MHTRAVYTLSLPLLHPLPPSPLPPLVKYTGIIILLSVSMYAHQLSNGVFCKQTEIRNNGTLKDRFLLFHQTS